MSTVSVGPGVSLSGAVPSYAVQSGPRVGQSVNIASTGLSGAISNVPKTVVEVVVSESFYFEYAQTTPASEWTITHNLGKRPNVSVYDSEGDEVLIDVEHLNNNTIHILWPVPTSGSVICS